MPATISARMGTAGTMSGGLTDTWRSGAGVGCSTQGGGPTGRGHGRAGPFPVLRESRAQ
jgi:hypothetical protein